MHSIILMAGSIIASTIGFALAGFILGEAIKNSRRQASMKTFKPMLDDVFQHSSFGKLLQRGYDTPELHREDTLARMQARKHRNAD